MEATRRLFELWEPLHSSILFEGLMTIMTTSLGTVEAISNLWTVDRPEQFPAELIEVVCSYFTGVDAFNLSLTNVWWRNYLSDESFWLQCFRSFRTSDEDHGKTKQSWKKQYIQSRSTLFQVMKVGDDTHPLDSFAYLTYTGDQRRLTHFQLTHMGGRSFSFDVWFSLLPPSSGERLGGIIYGVQSSSRECGEWPHYHHQYVMVSSKGDLYCSVLPDKSIVARNIKPNRWYHVALTYDHEDQRQDVYFNRVKVQSKFGTWRYTWHFMMYGQLGTGCSASETLNCSREGDNGWYAFQGVIDAFRVWSGVLSEENIAELANGGIVTHENLQASLKRDGSGKVPGTARLVKCTRPTEATRLQLVQ